MTQNPQTSKLQVLIDAGCIDPDAEPGLTPEQRSAIESLTWTEVDNLISARQKTGKRVGLFWI
jgi:hypothetical protein